MASQGAMGTILCLQDDSTVSEHHHWQVSSNKQQRVTIYMDYP